MEIRYESSAAKALRIYTLELGIFNKEIIMGFRFITR